MALFRYRCPACGDEALRLIRPSVEKGVPVAVPCEGCGGVAVRDPNPPTANAYERVDNGFMTKAVDKLEDVERMSRERSDRSKEQGR